MNIKQTEIKLTTCEIQSGLNRQSSAEGLILQLPETHDGRNTWLLNYGIREEAINKRINKGITFDYLTDSAKVIEDKQLHVDKPGKVQFIPDLPIDNRPICFSCKKPINHKEEKLFLGNNYHVKCLHELKEQIKINQSPPPLDEDTCLGCGKPIDLNYQSDIVINGDHFHNDCTPEGDPDYTKIINDIAEKLPVEDQICGVINPHKRDEVMSHNIGDSNYAKKRIQPWDIWEEYKLNAWDADIVKRVLRDKSSQSRRLDYEKIIHICQKRISQIDKGIKMYGEPESKVCENCCIVYNGNLNNCPKCGEANNE